MDVKKVTIDASKLAAQVADTQSRPLKQVDCPALPIVEILPSGRVEIVDGYHRIASMIAAGETQIVCLTCDDEATLGAAANAENPDDQADALAAIYATLEV